MPLVLDGTNGVSGVDGTASNPAIEGTDSNTGIFYPAADTIAFAEGGAEVARFDSAGNFGIGTNSPLGRLHTSETNGINYFESPGVSSIALQFRTNSVNRYRVGIPSASNDLAFYAGGTTETMRIDSSGNVGIGTSSPTQKLTVAGGVQVQSTNPVYFFNTDYLIRASTGLEIQTADFIRFTTNAGANERARIDSSGNLLVGATANPSLPWTSGSRIFADHSAADYVLHARNSSTTAGNNYGIAISYAGTPNNTGNGFIDARDSTAQRFQVRSNGGIANFSANNVNLSDARLKTDIQPATSYLAKICSIPVVTYLYKDQTDTELNLGVLAQDVEAVAPELVDNSGFGEAPEGEAPYKAIYQTDLQYALMKSIQEQQAIITQLQADVAALKGNA